MKYLLTAFKLLISDPRRFTNILKIKFFVPSNAFTASLRQLYCRLIPNKSTLTAGNPERLLFVYDTICNPVTFDFLHYLYYAEWLRSKAGKTKIDVLLVIRSNWVRNHEASYISAVGDDNIKWRITNLLVPLCRLFLCIDHIYITGQKEAFEIVKAYQSIHPKGYSYATPKPAAVRLDTPGFDFHPALTISDTARRIVEAYFPETDKRRIVTITLRTYNYISIRNSTLSSWIDFARTLDKKKYRVIFVPDASRDGVATFSELKEFDIFDSACWNIELRAALYRRAWMNMGVICGPLTISALMNDVWTIVIDRSLDFPSDNLQTALAIGVVPGKAHNFYSKFCRFHLGKDDKDTILKIFKEYDD